MLYKSGILFDRIHASFLRHISIQNFINKGGKMNKSTIRIIVVVLLIMIFIPSLVIAQDEGKEDNIYWKIAHYNVDERKIDSLKVLEEKYYIPIIAEAKKMGLLLESVLLIKETGNEYNVVIIDKYPSWAAIEKNRGWETAHKAIEPDKKKRDAVNAAYDWVFDGAKDKYSDLYYEATDY